MWPNPQETADLVTFTEENLNGKLHFLCSVCILKILHRSLCFIIKKHGLNLFSPSFEGAVMKTEKTLMINDCLRISKVLGKFCIPTTYNFVTIYLWNLLFSWKVNYFLTVSIGF